MEIINRTATVNLDTPHGITPRFRFVFSKADGSAHSLTGKSVSFDIYDGRMSLLFSAGSGIDVAGNVIDVRLEGAAYTRIREYPGRQYSYGMTVADDFRIQGTYRSLARAGPVSPAQESVQVVIASIDVRVSLAAPAVPSAAAEEIVLAQQLDRPASRSLAGKIRRREEDGNELLERCQKVGRSKSGKEKWAWCPFMKTVWR